MLRTMLLIIIIPFKSSFLCKRGQQKCITFLKLKQNAVCAIDAHQIVVKSNGIFHTNNKQTNEHVHRIIHSFLAAAPSFFFHFLSSVCQTAGPNISVCNGYDIYVECGWRSRKKTNGAAADSFWEKNRVKVGIWAAHLQQNERQNEHEN